MARSDLAWAAARGAYERARVHAALRGVVIAAAVTVLAFALQRMSDASWLASGVLAATLATAGWRGGAWRRGAFAGVLAGVPPLVAPTLLFAVTHGGHCPNCELDPTLACLATCLATSSLVGVVVGHSACGDAAPRRFALAAIATAVPTGLIACATTGYAGALGIVAGLVAGCATGWIVAGDRARA